MAINTNNEDATKISKKDRIPGGKILNLSRDNILRSLDLNKMNMSIDHKGADNAKLGEKVQSNACINAELMSHIPNVPNVDAIASKQFYFTTTETPMYKTNAVTLSAKTPKRRNKRGLPYTGSINKGVHHKIRRPSNAKALHQSSEANAQEINKLLTTIKNGKLTDRICNERKMKAEIEKNLYSVLRNAENPIAMAKPLNICDKVDDTDSDFEVGSENSAISDMRLAPSVYTNTPETGISDDDNSDANAPKKKFFTSGRSTSTQKLLSIVNNVTATYNKGKIALVPKMKPNVNQVARKKNLDFTKEKAQVDNILKFLDEDLLGNSDGELNLRYTPSPPAVDEKAVENQENAASSSSVSLDSLNKDLNTLILMAKQSLTNVATVDKYPTTVDAASNQMPVDGHVYQLNNAIALPSHSVPLDLSASRFDRAETFKPLSKPKSSRLFLAGQDSKQLQIDAGQKSFGAKYCSGCGLTYSANEPGEEILHRNFHASMHVFRYKGLLDADSVGFFTEYIAGGRILRITESSNHKRLDRIKEMLYNIDRELGIVEDLIPRTFVVYLAVYRSKVFGLCLVEPISKAYKYCCVNGVHSCSQKEFDCKIGIWRIWVHPLHRHHRIGTKLIETAQRHTIFAEVVRFDDIAFNAPTTAGIAFAKQVTKMSNFLIYD